MGCSYTFGALLVSFFLVLLDWNYLLVFVLCCCCCCCESLQSSHLPLCFLVALVFLFFCVDSLQEEGARPSTRYAVVFFSQFNFAFILSECRLARLPDAIALCESASESLLRNFRIIVLLSTPLDWSLWSQMQRIWSIWDVIPSHVLWSNRSFSIVSSSYNVVPRGQTHHHLSRTPRTASSCLLFLLQPCFLACTIHGHRAGASRIRFP